MKFPLFLGLLLAATTAWGQAHRVVVAPDGSGDYRTVQAAFDAVPASNADWLTIVIKPGTYKEKLTLAKEKTHVRLLGEDAARTILTFDDYNQRIDPATGKNIGTSGSASVHLYADDFTAENITFENSAGPVGQAVAAWVGGNRSSFRHCRFLGFQDTLYTFGYGSHQLYDDCYIEGTVDFIFGSSTAWFENCHVVGKIGGFFTAASTPDTVRYGYVFHRCRIDGPAPASTFYLGRPWRPYAKTVFLECQLGALIRPQGWDEWGKESNKQTAYYAEYKSSGPGANPGARAPWTHQLTKAEAKTYTQTTVLRGWQPGK
ncbi:pectin esterase [Hymenobacter sp. UV11]|uniref:pectinesterase family protein n=1 Tax=Hymenobacter sp. UV11 TaxID=1849735 RepID=UPI00105D15AC|nr:pectinesterase family protein [Hymenobacter sp. UV11]TDN38157.1 pectin esterase [Hymenobacter sp. UV11]TFZ67670.1 pectin esterase [Hymenobacter sp. UV11]